jgi:serine/threonine protein kinase
MTLNKLAAHPSCRFVSPSLRRFDIIKKLGQGTYGKVQLGINKETGQEVAIKTIKKSKIETEADLIRIRREVQIMSSVQHPNIIHIYEGELLGRNLATRHGLARPFMTN